VTFVENHDTEYRSSSSQQDPIKKDTLAANAFLLSMPGTPCVFYKHWKAYKKEIKLMIEARKLAGINNLSTFENRHSVQASYSNVITGSKGKLIVTVGYNTSLNEPSTSEYTEILSGYHYKIYISNDAYADWDKTVSRIETEEVDDFTAHKTTIFVRDENSWAKMNYYIWDSNNSQLNGNWPGKQVTDTITINGYKWYRQTFYIDSSDYYVNAVFSTNTGSPQTVDVPNITEDKFYVIKQTLYNGKYTVEDVTSSMNSYAAEDVNKDGYIDTQDVLKVYEYMQTVTDTSIPSLEDVNSDKKVDTQDVLRIYEYMQNN